MGKRSRVVPPTRPKTSVLFRYLDLVPSGQVNLHVYPDGEGPSGVKDLFGTETPSEPALKFQQRLTRCFELSLSAVLHDAPEGSRLVHGSIHGPEAPRRISHGWVLLPNDLMWEPITALVHDREEWYAWARAWDERSYTKIQAATNMLIQDNYGPWHEGRYP